MVAEMERRLIRERQQAGIEAAKAKGVYKGRKPSVPVAKVREMREAGQRPTAIAKALGISRMSVHRVLETGDESEVILPRQPLTIDFPSQSRPMPVGDISWPRYRELFVRGVALKLSWWFVPHETVDECEMAPIPM